MQALQIFWRNSRTERITVNTQEVADLCCNEIFHYALRRVGNVMAAEDIAVETCSSALESLARFDGRVELKIWLLGIARRKVIDALRKRSRNRESSLAEIEEIWSTGETPETAALQAEAGGQIRELVRGLPDLQREALMLQVVEGLSIAEIAALLGKSPSSVNSLLGRARETVRRRGAAYFRRQDQEEAKDV